MTNKSEKVDHESKGGRDGRCRLTSIGGAPIPYPLVAQRRNSLCHPNDDNYMTTRKCRMGSPKPRLRRPSRPRRRRRRSRRRFVRWEKERQRRKRRQQDLSRTPEGWQSEETSWLRWCEGGIGRRGTIRISTSIPQVFRFVLSNVL